MSRIEQASYPYVEGSHGIPFEQVDLGKENRVVSGSGRGLGITAEDSVLKVWDTSISDCLLAAFIKPSGAIGYFLKTDVPMNNLNRHPDMFAARFVDFAFHNFELLGHDIRKWHILWQRASVNYRQFSDLLSEGHDIQSAASGTWTGKMAIEHGFVFDNSTVERGIGNERIVADFIR